MALYAQTDFKPGYVITNSGDTVFGEIDYRGDKLMGQLCKFRTNKHIVNYSPSDLVAYRFIDGKYFVSREVADRQVFLEFLIKGQVNIYYLRDEVGDHYYIDKEGERLSELPYEEGIREVDGKKVFYRSKAHSRLLLYYMQDAPSVSPQIVGMKNPWHDGLIKLAENYHNEVCVTGEPCIVYEKKPPLFGLTLDAGIGVIGFHGFNNFMQGGVILNLWIPRANEKLYFRIGFLFSQMEVADEFDELIILKYQVCKTPIMLEYIYPQGFIRPKVAYGLSVYSKWGGCSTSFMGGVDIKVNKKIGCFLEYDVDFESLIIPKRLISQALLFGLSYRF